MEQVSCALTEIDEVTRDLQITIEKSLVEREFGSVLKETSRKAHLKGFRPGKAPTSVVMQHFGDRVRIDVAQRLIGPAIQSVIKEHELPVIGEPEISLQEIAPSSPLEFKARVFLMPKPTIVNYKGRSIKVSTIELTEDEIDKAIESARDAKADIQAPEGRDQVAENDVVALSLSIKDNEESEDRAEPFVDQLGSGKLPKAVEEALIGKKAGESVAVKTVVPEDFAREDLRGKEMLFSCKIESFFVKKLPEVNDDFAKNAGFNAEGVADLRDKVRAKLLKDNQQQQKADSEDAILTLLAEEHQFSVPQVLVDFEIKSMLYRFGAIRGDPREFNVAPFRERLGEVALKRARCAIIVDRVAEQEDITVNDDDREKMIQQIAQQSGSTVEATQKRLLGQGDISGFIEEVKRSKVMELLVSWSTVESA